MILLRYVKEYREDINLNFTPNFVTSQIFSTGEENLLMEYLLTSANLYYGLKPMQTRKFAYKFGQLYNKKLPENWKTHESASYDWLRAFMNRHPIIVAYT